VKVFSKASKPKILRSVAQSVCNSLFDENIVKYNRLFWFTRCQLDNSESLTIWSLAKQLGITFSGDEEQILKELECMERQDKN